MIVGSLLLILIAVLLLVLGLAKGSSVLLTSSIAASLLAAVALVTGARQAAAGRAEADDELATPTSGQPQRWTSAGAGEPVSGSATYHGGEPVEVTVPAQHVRGESGTNRPRRRRRAGPPESAASEGGSGGNAADENAVRDEPAQYLAAAEAATIAQLDNEVLVIDGRPRYHLAGCRHLQGRDSEPLPVREAVELGFTPCGRCEPGNALLADARRV